MDVSSLRVPAAAPSASDGVPDSTDGQAPAAVGRVRLTRASQKLTPLTEEPTVISSYDNRASVPPPKRSPSPEVAARRKEILDRAASIDRMNYFEMLGVSQDTPSPQIQAIFLTHAKRWHPDRLPPELNDVREACGRVFSRLSEASSTLCNEEQRPRYMRLLTDGGATPEDQEKIASVVEAATSFQKAEVMLKRGDITKAEEYCALAVRLDLQPDYVALLAWVQSQKAENQGLDAVARLEVQLTGAIDKSERCERALFYRGTLRKRLGKHEEAIDDFRRAFALNPRNLDAQREVRLFEMRKEKEKDKDRTRESLPPERKPSFIGKLFKK